MLGAGGPGRLQLVSELDGGIHRVKETRGLKVEIEQSDKEKSL
jgi:hypothetical protein